MNHRAPSAERPAFGQRLMDDFRLEQHVPEALWPLQVYNQEQPAQANERESEPVSGSGQRPVFLLAEHLGQTGDEIRPRRDAAEEEVEGDPPAPLRISNERIHTAPP